MNEKYTYTDIRQSDQWFRFWECIGWKRVTFDTNLSARVLKTVFGSSIIIENPRDINENILNKIEEYAKSNKAAFLQIKPGLLQSCDALEKKTYEFVRCPASVTKTGIIDLREPLDVLYAKVSTRVRHLIKTSQEKTRITIIGDYSNEDVDEFYGTYRQNGLTKRFFTHPRTTFHHFMEAFKNNCYLCSVKNMANDYLGGCVFACEGKTAWYMYAAINEKGRELAISYAMLWEGIAFLKSKGFEFLDLEGLYDERYPKTYKRHQGYSSFKEHFYPDIVYYQKIRINYFSKLFKLID
jgi:lipid II:glycine glycyltransferase (peptidoglycan interpeptide bridge formation enzyme)